MDKHDLYIGFGFLLFILGIAGIVQTTTPGTGLDPGLAFLAGVAFLMGMGFMAYGAAKSLTTRRKRAAG